jgi:hypothetical protein
MSKWVDDHVFFRIKCCYIEKYNQQRRTWCNGVFTNGGRHHDGGRVWYKSGTMPDGRNEEMDEDRNFDLRDFSSHNGPRSVSL